MAKKSNHQRVTIKDIARELNVSVSTVSQVLGGSKLFSEEMVQKVMDKSKELNYRPNILARGLVNRGSSLIGVILRDVEHSFFVNLISTIQRELEALNYNIILCNSHDDPTLEKKSISVLMDKFVEGIIITPIRGDMENVEIYNRCLECNIPLVLMTSPKKGVKAPSIVVDHLKGAQMATRHLIELGHRNILYLSNKKHELDNRKGRQRTENIERYMGFMATMEEAGLGRYAQVVDNQDDPEGGVSNEVLDQILALNPRPTAIFAYSDMIAINLIDQCQARGIQVPGDFSVVGFDDLPLCRYIHPKLTTIAQPKDELGSIAALTLLDMLQKKKGLSKVLQPTLIERQSTAPLKAGKAS